MRFQVSPKADEVAETSTSSTEGEVAGKSAVFVLAVEVEGVKRDAK
jgi:hypothetical protein